MPAAANALVDFAARPPVLQPAPSLDSLAEASRHYMADYLARIPAGQVCQATSAMGGEADGLLQDRVLHILLLLDMVAPLGFNAVARALAPISTRTLARKLALLQRKGLVRRSLVDNPPHVEYRLTEAGSRLTALLFPALVSIGEPPLPAPPSQGFAAQQQAA